MSAHNHFCKSCADARKGAPVPYEDLDPEMVDTVKALNTVPGMRTLDSCFGHSGSGDPKKAHQSNVYIGLSHALGENLHRLRHFWNDFFEDNYGKLQMPTGWVQFSLVVYPFDPDPDQLIRLNIDVEHDPAVDPRGAQEKKEALLYLQTFIQRYNETHSDFTAAEAREHAHQ